MRIVTKLTLLGLTPFVLVGASGAISGVLGFYLIWFPHNYVKVFFFFPFFLFLFLSFSLSIQPSFFSLST